MPKSATPYSAVRLESKMLGIPSRLLSGLHKTISWSWTHQFYPPQMCIQYKPVTQTKLPYDEGCFFGSLF